MATDVDGLQDLDAAIAALTNELRSELPQIVMSGAEIVEGEIRARAPVRTGGLVRHLDSTLVGRGLSATAVVQIEDSGPGGVEQHAALAEEFGTSKQAAAPFFRPGVAAASDKVERHLQDNIMNIINKAEQS
jgi:HK97 gp10 family phage protein